MPPPSLPPSGLAVQPGNAGKNTCPKIQRVCKIGVIFCNLCMDALVGTAYFCIVRIPARNKHEYGNIRFEKQAAVPVPGDGACRAFPPECRHTAGTDGAKNV